MRGSLTLGHVRGIPIRAHFSLLLVVPYLAFLMSVRFASVASMARVAQEDVRLPPLVWGVVLSVAIFGCVLLHELGHALVALRAGGSVRAITLMLLGGVSELQGLPKTAKAEGLVALAGPLVSFVLGLGALGLWALTPGPADLRFGLYYLGQINIVLGVFNLLPAFPMDGGRVLRALLALRLSRVAATRWAARIGYLFAALFVLLGLLGGNLLLALIGAFVWAGASAERAAVEGEQALEGLRVRDVMGPARTVVSGWESVSVAALRMAEERVTALVVVDEGRVSGVLGAHQIEMLPEESRDATPVRALTDTEVPRLHADEPLATALERMAEQNASGAPVLERGVLVGLLESEHLGRALRLRKLMPAGTPQPGGPRGPVSPPVEPRPPGMLHLDA